PMPTPGIAFLARSLRADAGVAISASHNPYPANGTKFFGPDGLNLADSAQADIEARMASDALDGMRATGRGTGKALRTADPDGRRVVVDCAHGAAYRIAPTVLSELGADVIAMGVSPDGHNINDGCGATAVGPLRERVRAENADVGIALDGDADRCILVDETGE